MSSGIAFEVLGNNCQYRSNRKCNYSAAYAAECNEPKCPLLLGHIFEVIKKLKQDYMVENTLPPTMLIITAHDFDELNIAQLRVLNLRIYLSTTVQNKKPVVAR